MEFEITKETLKDLDYIKNNIVSKFKNEVCDIAALGLALEAIINMENDIKENSNAE